MKIVDFYCPSRKLVTEVDGGQHYGQPGLASDEERAEILNGLDMTVLRFSNLKREKEFPSVCERIADVLNALSHCTEEPDLVEEP